MLLPLATAALMLLLGEGRRSFKALLNVLSTTLGLGMAVALLLRVQADGPAAFGVYLPGNWAVPFGIVLVADRLSALMAGAGRQRRVWRRCCSRWRAGSAPGVHFHPLFQLQLMGLNGAFLTGDLFNLFVFFEVMLAASYGLLLHGVGPARVRAGLHYIVINLVASLLFLIGVAVIYGVTGTLNMADIARKLPAVPASDRGAAACRCRDPGHRLPGQGGAVAAELLAAAGLRGGQRAGGRSVRHPHQGGRLCGAAAVDAVLPGRGRHLGRLRRPRAGVGRHRHAGLSVPSA